MLIFKDFGMLDRNYAGGIYFAQKTMDMDIFEIMQAVYSLFGNASITFRRIKG